MQKNQNIHFIHVFSTCCTQGWDPPPPPPPPARSAARRLSRKAWSVCDVSKWTNLKCGVLSNAERVKGKRYWNIRNGKKVLWGITRWNKRRVHVVSVSSFTFTRSLTVCVGFGETLNTDWTTAATAGHQLNWGTGWWHERIWFNVWLLVEKGRGRVWNWPGRSDRCSSAPGRQFDEDKLRSGAFRTFLEKFTRRFVASRLHSMNERTHAA